MNPKPISENGKPPGCSRIGLIIFGLVFLAAGLLTLWFIAIYPMIRWNQARTWEQANCKILTSKIVENHDDDGSSYKPEITFEYSVAGKKHTSDQVDFMDFSGSRKRAQSITSRYPAKADATCFYDPDNPADAVLIRDSPLSFWMLFPFPFILVGGFVIYLAATGKFQLNRGRVANRLPIRNKNEAGWGISSLVNSNLTSTVSADWVHEADEEDRRWDQPQKLKPKTTRVQQLMVAGCVAVFWNGIVSVFVYALISGEMGNGVGETVCFSLFLLPFVLVGLAMIAYFFHGLLSLFNPDVEIAMTRGTVALGSDVDLAWEFTGKVERIRQLAVTIVGTESATYIRGTSTYADDEVFCKMDVLDTVDPEEMRFGNQAIQIPASSMHTFEAANNQIKWSVEVHGKIPFWPDVKQSFPFRVKPADAP